MCELKTNTWYKATDSKAFYYITKINLNGDFEAYGLDWKGDWQDKTLFGNIRDNVMRHVIEASRGEIFQMLEKEADKRGLLIEGVKIKTAFTGVKRTPYGKLLFNLVENDLKYDRSQESTLYCTIFSNDNWAEVIEKPNVVYEITLPDELVIDGIRYVKAEDCR